MVCAYEGAPNIMRPYGRGQVMQFNEPGFADITAVQDSCGWAVPFMKHKGERDQLRRYIDHMEPDAWHEGRLRKNAQSIDGLPAPRRSEVAE
jgi:hypothetical protein